MTKALAVGPEEYSKIACYPLLREQGVEYVIGRCESISTNSVVTSTGITIQFDLCVLAVGQKYPLFHPDPITENTTTTRLQAIINAHNKIIQAKSIVIAGGGPVGTEIAADIKLRFKDKRVILVHSHAVVLNSNNWGLPEIATKTLISMGIEYAGNDKVREYNASTNTVSLISIL